MNADKLDPGIREVVLRLSAAGFETTDSGDGRSQVDDPDALDYPHVAACTAPIVMVSDAERMLEVLGDGWTVQASYSTDDRRCVLFAYRPLPAPPHAGEEHP